MKTYIVRLRLAPTPPDLAHPSLDPECGQLSPSVSCRDDAISRRRRKRSRDLWNTCRSGVHGDPHYESHVAHAPYEVPLW
jgi:hypothetical protein